MRRSGSRKGLVSDFSDTIDAKTAAVATRRKLFVGKWGLKCRFVEHSSTEAMKPTK
jgi:hypothetical protein